jgi:hypothetical protein
VLGKVALDAALALSSADHRPKERLSMRLSQEKRATRSVRVTHAICAASFVAALSIIAGCASKEYLRATAIATPDVSVTPLQIWIGGKKLWVRVNVVNNSKSMIVVDRDAMTAHTASGQTVPRAIGTYTQHVPYNILPGSFHPVYVEFEEAGFDWREVGAVQIDFANSILLDGQAVPVPMLVVNH